MEETVQFNIRLPKELVYDLEYIASNYKINRSDWLKVKLAEMLREEKHKIMRETEVMFIQGSISDEEFKDEMGFEPTEEIKELKKRAMVAARSYFEEILKSMKSNESESRKNSENRKKRTV